MLIVDQISMVGSFELLGMELVVNIDVESGYAV